LKLAPWRTNTVNSEEIVQHLLEFVANTGKIPELAEPGLEKLIQEAIRTFGSLENALRIAGLQTDSTKESLISKIRRILNYNPMTFKDLREELDNDSRFLHASILTAVKKASDLRSIGSRRSKVYFLEGQERLAQTCLDKILSKVTELQDEIYNHLRQPTTRGQLEKVVSEITGAKKTTIARHLNDLLRNRAIYKMRFAFGSRGGQKYNSFDLFGDLSGKMYFCRFDCPNEVGHFTVKNIPREKLGITGFRSSLTRHLKRILPKDVFHLVDKELDVLAQEEGKYIPIHIRRNHIPIHMRKKQTHTPSTLEEKPRKDELDRFVVEKKSCGQQPKKTADIFSLEVHIPNEAIAYCTRCEKLFYYRDAWEKHKKECHEINENQS